MESISGKQLKVLKEIHKNYKKDIATTKSYLSQKLDIEYKEICKICNELNKKGFVNLGGLELNPYLTPDGIDYFSNTRNEWFSEHFIETISLLFSLISLIFSIIAFFLSLSSSSPSNP